LKDRQVRKANKARRVSPDQSAQKVILGMLAHRDRKVNKAYRGKLGLQAHKVTKVN
jgi:hypothetical protein